jgi:hypothetical protein
VITINTQYTLAPGRVLTIEAGFSSASAMFNGTGQSIPTYNVTGAFSSTGSVFALPGCSAPPSGLTALGGGYSCGWINYPAITGSNTSGSHTDTLTMSLNPSFTGAAPGAYTGNLLISAQAN